MKSLLVVVVVMAVYIAQPAQAQWDMGSFLIGPHIGFTGYGDGGIAFGANIEKAFIEEGKVGPGSIGFSGRLDYFRWSYLDFYAWTWITFGIFANYHYPLDNKSWDPFGSLGLVYESISFSSDDPYYNNSIFNHAYASGITIAGNVGIRYFFSRALAARAMAGFGITWLVLGVDFGV